MKLIARVKDPELFFSLVHEFGQTFYRTLGKNKFEVVYFSGNRFVRYSGTLSEEQIKRLEIHGFKVDKIEIDDMKDLVRIVQGEET